jgi:predicted Rossmann fold flavoprotein
MEGSGMKNKGVKVGVIGGGVSGMTTAIIAAKNGADVTLFEMEPRLGRKILATGNGKCNVGNVESIEGKYNTNFSSYILSEYGIDEIRKFLAALGVLTKVIDGRVFPYSGEASTVQNALRKAVEDLKVNVVYEEVFSITKGFKVNDKYSFDRIVVATGSPATFGKDSTKLLSKLGHDKVDMKPALVPFTSSRENLKGLRGVRIIARAYLVVDGVEVCSELGEVLFKDNGISGSAIFDLSVKLARLTGYKNVDVRLDLMPEFSGYRVKELVSEVGLSGMFHKELCLNIMLNFEISKDIAFEIKNYIIKNVKLGPFNLAQIASGGLKVEQFDEKTLESKLCKWLFATGEVLNVDGECGGYNLMWAFASGMKVGEMVVK